MPKTAPYKKHYYEANNRESELHSLDPKTDILNGPCFVAINAPHKKHYYEAAQAAHEELFVSTNKQIVETYQIFEKA